MLKYLLMLMTLLALIVVIRLDEFSLSDVGQQHTFSIEHRGERLAGTLILPVGIASPPVVLLVHGDGPQDRWSESGYIPLVNFLVKQGIGVFSWDKPGVGESSGNWLAQTMDDRADEAAAVLTYLRQEPALTQNQMGFLGFSQAGWVVPAASEKVSADFALLVGPAINWREQGIYYLRQRMMLAGESASKTEKAVTDEATSFDRQFTPEKVSRLCTTQCTRDDFERRNALADAKDAISSLHIPVMVLMGDTDRNVSPQETLAVWKERLPENTPRCLRRVAGATHGLLRSRWLDYQLVSEWPWWKQGAFLLVGREAYAPEALVTMSDWILHRQCPD